MIQQGSSGCSSDIRNGKSNPSTSDFSGGGQSDIPSLPSLKDSGLLDLRIPGSRDLKPRFLDDDWQQSPPLQEQFPQLPESLVPMYVRLPRLECQ